MDLSSFKKKDTTDVELRLPNYVPIVNDDGTPMTVTISGIYSPKYREALDEQQSARLKRMQSSGGKMMLTQDEIRSDRVLFVASMVEDWNITLDGEKPACTPRIVRDVFERFQFIYDQLDRALEDGQSFLETSFKP